MFRNAVATVFCVSLAVGCAHVNNPWVDSSTIVLDDLTTASAEGYCGKREFDSNRWRTNWPASRAVYENGAVTHWPTWFEDPFEEKGNRDHVVADVNAPDDEFAMNWVDYLHLAYGPARFVLNGALWPVSAVVTPPGTLMESDGKLSPSIIGCYDHDPARSDSATREPPFINDIDRTSDLAASSDTDS